MKTDSNPSRKTIREIQDLVPRNRYQIDVPLTGTTRNILHYGVNMDPIYQRGYVWTVEQQEKFVGAAIENATQIPPIYLNFLGEDQRDSEIVDGKQRLNAICQWESGLIVAQCPCGERVSRESLTEVEKRELGMMTSLKWRFVLLSKKECMEFYLRLNSGGAVHTSKDLEKVRKLLKEMD